MSDGMNLAILELSRPRTTEALQNLVRTVIQPPAIFHEGIGVFFQKAVNSLGQMHPDSNENFIVTPRSFEGQPASSFEVGVSYSSICVANIRWLGQNESEWSVEMLQVAARQSAFWAYLQRLEAAEKSLPALRH